MLGSHMFLRLGSRAPRGLGAVVLVIGIVFAGLAVVGGRARALPPATHVSSRAPEVAGRPVVDPRLILHPRTVRIAGSLSEGIRLSGTLYPAIPGRNTLRLALWRDGHEMSRISPLTIAVTMPGMRMTPARSRLIPTRGAYMGSIVLPMFGIYRAQLSLEDSQLVVHGSIHITLSFQPSTSNLDR